jgi:hypothetical protein
MTKVLLQCTGCPFTGVRRTPMLDGTIIAQVKSLRSSIFIGGDLLVFYTITGLSKSEEKLKSDSLSSLYILKMPISLRLLLDVLQKLLYNLNEHPYGTCARGFYQRLLQLL